MKKIIALWGCFANITYTNVWRILAITKVLIKSEANHIEGFVVNQINVTIYHIRMFSKSFKCALRTRSISGSLVATFAPFRVTASSGFKNICNIKFYIHLYLYLYLYLYIKCKNIYCKTIEKNKYWKTYLIFKSVICS